MGYIVYFEWKKILLQWKYFLFVAVLFAGQFLLFWYNEIDSSSNDKISYASYNSLADDVRNGKITEEEIANRANLQEEISCSYANTWEKERTLFREMEKELQQIEQYPNYIKNILYAENSFAAMEKEFDRREGEQTKRDYAAMEAVEPFFCGAYGVSVLCGINPEDFMVVLIILLLAVSIVSQEREKHTDILLHSMAKGRKDTGAVKFLFGLFLSVVFVLTVYLGRIFLVVISYGIGDPDAPVQSIPGFSACVWRVSIGQYLGWYLLLKVIGGLMIYSLCFLVINLFMEAWKAFIVNVIGGGVCYFCYQNIAANSWMAMFKWYNPFAFFDSGRIFAEYRTVKVFSYPVSFSTISVIICHAVILVSGIINIFFYEKSPLAVHGKTSAGRRHLQGLHIKRGLFTGELYKCFVCQRGIALCIITILFTVVFVPSVEEHLTDLDMVYYRSYIRGVEGKYSKKKLNSLYAEKDKIDQSEKKLDEDNMTVEAFQLLSQTVQRKKGLNRAVRYGEYLQKQGDVHFIYDAGYREWMGINCQTDTLFYMDILAVLLQVMLCVSVWWIEESTGMVQLIRISSLGEKKIAEVKKKAVCACSVLTWGMFYGYFTYQIGEKYGFSGLNASVRSIMLFSALPSWIKIWMVILLIYLLRLSYLILVGSGVRIITSRSRGYLYAVIISSTLFLIPVLVVHMLI